MELHLPHEETCLIHRYIWTAVECYHFVVTISLKSENAT